MTIRYVYGIEMGGRICFGAIVASAIVATCVCACASEPDEADAAASDAAVTDGGSGSGGSHASDPDATAQGGEGGDAASSGPGGVSGDAASADGSVSDAASGVGGSGAAAGAAGGDGGAAGGDAGAAGSGGSPGIGPVVEPGDPGAVDVVLDIRADRELRPISRLVYGTNGAPEIARTRQTVVRSGGNRLTAYNWENNASNAGSDWYFQNDGYLSDSDVPGKVASDVVDAASANGAAAIVTIPIVDYVSADKDGGGDVRNSGSDYLFTRFRQNVAVKGAPFSDPPDTTDDFVYQDEFANWLKEARPDAEVLFSLDNEPDLWSHTHAEVHPDPVTYAELWERNQRFSAAIKTVWPTSKVLGFVSYGFNGYVNLQNAPDANGRDFVDWYLDQAQAAETANGYRLIDYLDLHWYPEARGGGRRITEDDNSDPVVAARVQAPRSLWDDTYEETSWVRDYLGEPIDLLNRLHDKIDTHYPGTLLACTEWNYGGGGHVSGAIATADVLGIFGREGVGLAAYWPLSDDESFAYAAFRAYRNYDGQGAAFGDTAISATSSDVPAATVYASIDAADPNRTVIIAINKATSATTAGLRIAHAAAYESASVWVLSGTQPELLPAAPLDAVATNTFRYALPPQSVNVIVPE